MEHETEPVSRRLAVLAQIGAGDLGLFYFGAKVDSSLHRVIELQPNGVSLVPG